MEAKVDFPTHKAYLVSSWVKDHKDEELTAIEFALHEPVRIFIWSLVQSLQEYHLIEECPQKVEEQNIVVSGCHAFIVGDCDLYEEQKALQNYKSLKKFLVKRLFTDYAVKDLPYCVSQFLKLLVDQPLDKRHLIGWHVGHLSTAYTICFINNIARALVSAKPENRSKIRASIEAVNVDENWENRFVHPYEFLMVKFRFKDSSVYDSVHPSKRKSSLVQFLHDTVDHAGVEKRTTVEPVHLAQWMGTSTVPEELKADVKKRRRRKGDNKEPDAYLNTLIHHLFVLFPQFLTDLQYQLHEHGVLKVVSPSPEEILHF